MGILYVVVAIVFVALVIVNLTWLGINLYHWAINGLQFLLQEMNFVERVYFSIYLKWILLADAIFLLGVLSFAIARKHYKTDPRLHYLKHEPIQNPSTCVIIPTYNEEKIIENVVKDFKSQEHVKYVIVIDNNSSDNTVSIAERCGAKVLKNQKNMGMAYSCVKGFSESLKTDTNIVVLVEGDGTCNGYDLRKMVPYLDNCDMVVGTRQLQVLSEKGNQNKMSYVWANYYLAKLIQIKFFSLLHRGVINFTDVGCTYRAIRKESLSKIIDKFYDPNGKVVPGLEFTAFMSIISLQKNLRIIEVPVSFKKRIGFSKTGSDKGVKALKIGWKYIWCILST